jgi:RNA polymerase sigma-70 factor (ECF subfamily)
MEETLVRRMQAGDESAFDELFALYQKQAVRTAALITGDAALAEDVAQETFVLCLLHINNLREPSRFRPWFFRTLTRSAWKVMQNKLLAIDLRNLPEIAEETEPYPSEKAAAYEKLYRALDGLGRKQRTTVILYYFNDLSIKEIAEATGTLESTVKTRLFAARRRLKQVLEAEEKKGEVVYERF